MNLIVDRITIAGYHLIETLYAGSKTLIYRARRDQEGVVIKLLRREYPTFSELLQFRNQYIIAKHLEIPGIVRPDRLEPHQNGYALVMEDIGGISLRDYTKTQSLHLNQFLAIAIQLAEILNGLYHHRVIHKDIKPANILIQPETQQIQLIDFSISSLLPREMQEVQNPNVLEGTLAYLSPEQTGRMNRGIDYRTDFYSLGVTFYELLTGELPFTSDDPMELIHCHIAKQPPSICDRHPHLPPVLSAIVDKLMAKNAEDRYQSALGIEYDLEQCLEQLQTTGKIESFPLGQRDICDRFTIPEKLYGRQAEIETLLAAFERVAEGSTELMLVAGFSGIGKTAVVNEVHKPIVRQRGYFIKGKFDQYNRNIPFSAFVQAFRDLMGQLLSESDAQLQQWRSKILSALGENGQVIIEVIPELEQIIGQQPPVPEFSANAAQNRFNLLFQKFITTFTTPEHPLVIFLDDLQWADLASLKLMQLLMSENQTGYLLLMGAYRDNEVTPAHALMLTLDEIKKAGTTVNTLTLAPLKQSEINQLIAETLSCPPDSALPFTKLVYQKTKGNPFFNNQFLKVLHEEGLITFNIELGYWQCDIVRVNASALTDDVVEFMAIQLHKLPQKTQDILKLAACIGNQFDLATLAIVRQQSQVETANDLWKALQEGLILPSSEVYKFFQGSGNYADSNPFNVNLQIPTYRFLHDRVQQAAYSLIPEAQKQSTHLKIGQLLLANTPPENREEKIFEIVNQFNRGVELLAKLDERYELAQLNSIAGQKAKAATAYGAAWEYLAVGRQLLPTDCWETQYSCSLNLYELSVEAAYLTGDFEAMENLATVAIAKAQTLLDRIKVYEIKIQGLMAQNQFLESLNTGLQILKLLGIEFPEKPSHNDITIALQETQLAYQDKQVAELINLPLMTDPIQLAAMRLLSSILSAAYLSCPELYVLLTLKEVNLSIQYGNTPFSAHSYTCYGLILCGAIGEIEVGNQFGQLALDLLHKLNAKELQCKVYSMVYGFIKHWKDSVSSTLIPLRSAYSMGLETGDFQFAGYSAVMYAGFTYFAGISKELSELQTEFCAFSNSVYKLKQMTAFQYAQILQQALHDLRQGRASSKYLAGEYCDEKAMLSLYLQNNDRMGLFYLYCHKLLFNYLLGDYQQAVEDASGVEQYLDGATGFPYIPIFYFYDSLARLAAYRENPNGAPDELLLRIKANQEKMKKWAHYAPMNCLHKFDLVEAEYHRIFGKKYEAIDLYDRAIAGAKENGYMREEALANELAAQLYLDWGKERIAREYLTQAYYCYARWGAKAKTDDLEIRYPQLLAPILQQAEPELTTHETLVLSNHSTTSNKGHLTSSSVSVALDLLSVLKAYQTLSKEIELDKLLVTLLQVTLENAGADKCALILHKNNRLFVEAVMQVGQNPIVLQSVPLENSSDIPASVINLVRRSQQLMIIMDASLHPSLETDPYILRQMPKSLLCTPILHQGKLSGILYLENSLVKGAFTRDRVELLNVLCTQAAISLENAYLYQQAQQALHDLQKAQLQIVQSEKMSALGNLVAGVAHEINNPIGFLSGNLKPAQNYLANLFKLLDLYGQEYPEPTPTIKKEIATLDLDYLREDFPKLLNSMNLGIDRIRNISTSLRTFSRADKDYKVPFNLHEGLDSTLLILKHRLKANEHRPEIKVVKNYGDLPLINCFPGQLNQVFMNILANAIDALDEGNEGRSFADLKAAPNQITIQTTLADPNSIKIFISDNGVGMSEAVKNRIFDHLFTTKAVGKGTGLGLAIAYQIVVEKHGGTIEVNSVLGRGTEFAIALPVKGEV